MQMRLKVLLILAILSFKVVASPAPDPVVPSFQQAGKQIPEALIEKGYVEFGAINLQDLVKSMSTIKAVSIPRFARPNPSDGYKTARSSAEWFRDPAGNYINISETEWPKIETSVQPMLALHEYLGAIGFNDENYLISSAMWLAALATPDIKSILSANEIRAIESSVENQATSGGITAVGGGGDQHGIKTKMKILSDDLDAIAKTEDPDIRQTRLNKLMTSLYKTAEIKWKGPSNPPDFGTRKAVTENFNHCKTLLTASPLVQRRAYATLQAHSPHLMKHLPNLKAVLDFCRFYVKRGLKAALKEGELARKAN